MLNALRTKIAKARDDIVTLGRRGRIQITDAVRNPPALHDKSREERVKHAVTVLNTLAVTLFGIGFLAPALNATQGVTWTGIGFAVAATMLVFAARHWLRYIPNPDARKESDDA